MKSILFSLMAMLAFVAFIPNQLSAQEEDMATEDGTMTDATITQVASNNQDLSYLVAALNAAGLAETLEGDGPFTVFAPSNDAFRALPPEVFQALTKAENRQSLIDILNYHVVSGEVNAEDVIGGIEGADNGEFMAGTLNGDVTAMLDGENVMLQDAKGNSATVTQPDVSASNGVVHIIDAVLLPENVDIDALLSSTAEAVQDTTEGIMEEGEEMAEEGMQEGEEMVEQGEEVAESTMEEGEEMVEEGMQEGEEMVEGTVEAADEMTDETMQDYGQETASVGSDVTATGNTIVGVASGSDDFKTLTTAIQAAELVDLLDNTEAEFTVFAPTEEAFGKLPEGTISDLTQESNKEKLQGILSYHVVANKIDAAALTSAIESNDGYFRIQTIDGNSLSATIEEGNVILIDANGNRAMVTSTDVQADNGIIHVIDTVLMPKEKESMDEE